MSPDAAAASAARQRRAHVEALFERALDVPAAQRDAWLAANCEEAAIRGEVSALLAADALGDDFERAIGMGADRAAAPAPDAGAPDRAAVAVRAVPTAAAERRIGPYRVVRELGRGGMGVVYLAERDDGQFHRRVAIKLLRGSPDADELHQRFLAERQILASLAHPNIAQLLDGGVTDGQLPYLVMEYVDGLPISAYCDRHRLGIAARLRLFQDVCRAVQHAHSNLIIHRDLKPGNILVTGEGQVKLLDFGIAKLVNPVLGAGRAPITRTEFRVLTPEYASPEQVRGETLTTTSDVYALGVILYELLAGQPPYRLATRSPRELARVIEEREPTPPSARFDRRALRITTEPGEAAAPMPADIAAARDTTIDALRRALRGDLDAIVGMSLRKEPGRRYGSADLLATDIGRYLDGQSVLARRGSGWYRLGKLVRRHRAASLAASVVFLSLFAGGALALGQARLADIERARAEEARSVAERALRESEQVGAFLMNLFEASDPLESGAAGVTARDLLRRGESQAEQLNGEPLVQAQMFEVIGRVQRGLGEHASARSTLERALAARRALLGEHHIDVSRTLYHLTEAHRNAGRYADGIATARAGLQARSANPDGGWPDVPAHLMQLAGMVIYAGEIRVADTLATRALALRRLDPGAADSSVASSLEFMAAVKRRRGEESEAESHLRQAIALRRVAAPPDGRALGTALLRLGDLLSARGRVAEADAAYGEAVPMLQAVLGDTHPLVLAGETTYAHFRAALGEYDAAEQTLHSVAERRARVFGADHPNAVTTQSSIARLRMLRGDYAAAEPMLRRSLEARAAAVGRDNSGLAGDMINLAEVLDRTGRPEAADSVMAEVLRIRTLLNSRPLIGLTHAQHAEILVARRDFVRADSLFQLAVAMMHDEVDVRHHDLRRIHEAMAGMYEATGRAAEAAHYRQLARLP